MDEHDWLAERFEENRGHLRAVAYRMLGSLTEADDAVQEAWLRLSRSDTRDIHNLGGWLTTVVARVSLNMLRSRASRREEPLDSHVPDPVISREEAIDPEDQALLAEGVGLALLVVLETLAPAERLAFVLHDMFAVPFEEIAAIRRQREVVDAFFAAARGGDFDALVAVLDPDVVLRSDGGVRRPAASVVVHGAATVAGQALTFAQPSRLTRPALVNGAPGVVVVQHGRPFAIMGFTVMRGKIVEIDVLTDPERLRQLDLTVLDD